MPLVVARAAEIERSEEPVSLWLSAGRSAADDVDGQFSLLLIIHMTIELNYNNADKAEGPGDLPKCFNLFPPLKMSLLGNDGLL